MFHGEGCLNSVFHFLIVPVYLCFHSMTSITSWCLNVIIKHVSWNYNLRKLKCMSVNTFDTAVCIACLFPYSTEIIGSKEEEEEEEEEEE